MDAKISLPESELAMVKTHIKGEAENIRRQLDQCLSEYQKVEETLRARKEQMDKLQGAMAELVAMAATFGLRLEDLR